MEKAKTAGLASGSPDWNFPVKQRDCEAVRLNTLLNSDSSLGQHALQDDSDRSWSVAARSKVYKERLNEVQGRIIKAEEAGSLAAARGASEAERAKMGRKGKRV